MTRTQANNHSTGCSRTANADTVSFSLRLGEIGRGDLAFESLDDAVVHLLREVVDAVRLPAREVAGDDEQTTATRQTYCATTAILIPLTLDKSARLWHHGAVGGTRNIEMSST